MGDDDRKASYEEVVPGEDKRWQWHCLCKAVVTWLFHICATFPYFECVLLVSKRVLGCVEGSFVFIVSILRDDST